MICFLGFALLLFRSSNILKREIHKIAMASDNISRRGLDYEREYSRYKEIDGVLVSIDVRAKNLKNLLVSNGICKLSRKSWWNNLPTT